MHIYPKREVVNRSRSCTRCGMTDYKCPCEIKVEGGVPKQGPAHVDYIQRFFGKERRE